MAATTSTSWYRVHVSGTAAEAMQAESETLQV